MVEAAIGYKCRECANLKTAKDKEYPIDTNLNAGLSAILVGMIAGYIWNYFSGFSPFITLGFAYIVGFIVCKTVVKIAGSEVGNKMKTFVAIITLISMAYNPILIVISAGQSSGITNTILAFTFQNISNIISILAYVIAVWASIRHFRM